MLVRKITLVMTLLLVTGCGVLDRLRGHNIQMARSALVALEEPIDEAFEEKKANATTPEELEVVELEHLSAKFDLMDLERRLDVAQRDFPAPEVPEGEEPVKRSTLEESSEEDEFRYVSYAGLVAKRQERKAFWLKLREELKKIGKIWDWTIWALTAAIYVVIALIVYIVIRKLRWVYHFLSNLLDELGLDKEAKERLAGGTPVEDAYRRKKKQYRKKYKYDNSSSSTPTSG